MHDVGIALGNGEQDDNRNRLVVERLPRKRILRRADGERGLVHTRGLAVRDGDTHTDAGLALALAPHDILEEALTIVELSLLLEQVGQSVKHLLLGVHVEIKRDELLVDHVGDVEPLGSLCHDIPPPKCLSPSLFHNYTIL